MSFETGLLVVAAILVLAFLAVIHRMVVGPTILERAVASDMLLVLAVLGLALYAAVRGPEVTMTAMLGITATGFLTTVAIARFLGRQEAARRADPDGAGTPRHEVLHGVPGQEDEGDGEVEGGAIRAPRTDAAPAHDADEGVIDEGSMREAVSAEGTHDEEPRRDAGQDDAHSADGHGTDDREDGGHHDDR
ncbi:monovalent cation/H+ antiporter complex subunit F [Brachybacterium huguangmaarense]